MQISPDKNSLRRTFLGKREALPQATRETAAEALCEAFIRHVSIKDNAVIAGYVPIRSELNVMPLLTLLHYKGYRCALPAIGSKEERLLFRLWTPDMLLNRGGAYAIPEPPITAEICMPTMVIVPLVACDRTGVRLGYGQGFYDRTLKSLRRENPLLQVIGVGYSCQIAEKLPCDAHDEPLDNIVTENEFIIC